MSKSNAHIDRPASRAEADQARRALGALRRGRLGSARAVPPAAAAALERVLEAMARGDGVAVIALDSELTTQEAADLLGISRPTLVKRLEEGVLPFRTLGVHRRIKAAEVVAYLERERPAQQAALDKMVADNQRAGLYD